MDITKLKEYSQSDDTLRPYQHENKERVYDAWETCQSVMLQMPTGTGKTRLFVSIIKDIFHYSRDTKHAYKVLILVHRKELVDQIDEELGCRYGLAHGIIQSGDRERKRYPIQIASVQTLSRRLDRWTDKEFDFVIIDEAHHTTAQSYQEIIKAFPHAKLLGVTATPCRLNGEGFTGTFETLILSAPISKFINDGYLSDYLYYSVPKYSFIQKEIDGIKKFRNGDYDEHEIEKICDNNRIRAQVVNTYLEYAKGKKGIVYTINKTHNKNLCDEFLSHGINAVAIDSDTPKQVREGYIEDFKNGRLEIICNVNLFTEGFDCPDIEFVQLARPTKSLALYLQQVGRGLRISEGKEKTVFLDNVGLYNKFGLPKARRHWQQHFQGKLESEITEENVSEEEPKKNSFVKRKRNQDLSEGNEKVFLIESPDDKEYLEQRIELFWNLIDEYHGFHVAAINEFFQKRNFQDQGMCISRETEYNEYGNWNYYHIKYKEETALLKERFADYVWDQIIIDDEGNVVGTERNKRPKDYQEYAHHLESGLNWTLRKKLKTNLKPWAKRFIAGEFTNFEELCRIIVSIMDREFTSIPDYCEDDRKPDLIKLWRCLNQDLGIINHPKNIMLFTSYFLAIICVINNSTMRQISCNLIDSDWPFQTDEK